MAEYKAGDRVLIKGDAIEDGWLLPGEEGTISEFDECASYCEGHLIFRNEDGDVSNYDLDEVTLVESKSAFKAGQKVRITQDTSCHRREVGDIVTLSVKGDFGAWRIEEAHADTDYQPWVREADMEPYTEEPKEDDEPFPVGTKVRVTGDTHGSDHRLPTGTVGEVVEISGVVDQWRLVAHTEKREWGIDPTGGDARNVHIDDLEIVSEPEVEIVDIWDTEGLKVGDVVVREESLNGWGEEDIPAQVERKVVKAPEPEPRRNDLPTTEGSLVKFYGYRLAVLTGTQPDGVDNLEWVFMSGVPVKELFDPFTTEVKYEVKYDAGK